MGDNLNRRILVIDDNRTIHEDFRKILAVEGEGSAYGEMSADLFGGSPEPGRSAGFDLDSAYQGRQGLEMVKQSLAASQPYGVAFIDVRMPPGWDGIETTARIWEVCPDLQVVICTAYSDYGWDDIAHKLGQTDGLLILKKPFDTVEVLHLAETLAHKWTLARQAALRLGDLEALANQRTQALRAAHEKLTQEIAERSRTQARLCVFSTLGSLLSTARTIRQASQIIVDTAERMVGWDACLLDLYSPDTDMLTPVFHADVIEGQRKECLKEYVQEPPTPLVRKTLQDGGQLVLKSDSARMLPTGQPFGDTSRPSAAIMFVPIHNGTTIIGVLSIQSYTPKAYDQRSLETLQALADYCGGALDRIQTEETLRRAQEQLRQSQKLEGIGQLAGGVAHDFNNLLTVIIGSADHARSQAQGLSSELTECLDHISDASERAANLTRQLLAFSRNQIMQIQPVDLDSVIVNLSKMLKRIIGEDIDLRCHCAPALPPVQADIQMLEVVLMNLVVNARDAMPGGGQLLITTLPITFEAGPDLSHPEARPGDFACVTVKDTGTGICPENLRRIFEPFFTTKDVGKGTGLGLATVYGIVKQHHGWVEVSSQVGAGSTFAIYLPALEAAQQANIQHSTFNAQPPIQANADASCLPAARQGHCALSVEC